MNTELGSIGKFIEVNQTFPKTEEILKLPGYRQPKDEDLAEAKKLMAEAGYADGVDVVMDSRAGTTDERRATFLKDQLAKIGIRAAIKLNELANMYKIINAYTLAFFGRYFKGEAASLLEQSTPEFPEIVYR